MPRNKQKNLARAAAQRAEKQRDTQLTRNVAAALSGCSDRVLKAVSAPSVRSKCESTSMCLPEVAKYQAGYRNVRRDAVHIIK